MGQLMIQGTASNVGKSLTVLALCKIFKKEGFNVAPFKPQNMSLNSIVTENDEEISYIQYLQAKACNATIDSRINPILLKPMGNGVVEVIVRGKHYKDMRTSEYYDFLTKHGKHVIKESYESLRKEYDTIISEGAGSPAEINLYEFDYANMKFAEMFNIPTIIVCDIERGGAFASLYGTFMLLKKRHKKLVRGFIINKFRGDKRLLYPGLKYIEKKLGRKIFGVIPYINDIRIFEDSLDLKDFGSKKIGVIRYPTLSIYEDLIYLGNYSFINDKNDIDKFDVIILPGSKNVINDLMWLKRSGIAEELKRIVGRKLIIGICGGYQMLTKKIYYNNETYKGLGLIDAYTYYKSNKIVRRVKAKFLYEDFEIDGFEIRFGRIVQLKGYAFKTNYGYDGFIDFNKKIIATNIHGLFKSKAFRNFLKKRFNITFYEIDINKEINRISKVFKENIDIIKLVEILKRWKR